MEEVFGMLKSTKFWYGLKELNKFTQTGQWELRTDFQFENKTWSHLHYQNFSVGNAMREYPLFIDGYGGIVFEDPFETISLDSEKFSTVDNDNDKNINNCAFSHGGWWYNSCSRIQPNQQPPMIYLGSSSYQLLAITLKMHPSDCII